MAEFDLAQAAAWMAAHWQGANQPVRGVSTDTRRLQAGELFIALQGPRFDGHDHLAAAQAAGAVAAVVSRPVNVPLPQLQVDDTLHALGRLGAAWRQRFQGTVVALTGSNGKTTVKEMIAAILRQCGSVLSTAGNLNNEIGVPLTLLRLADEQYAVIEMGANHHGEIAYLTSLVQPHVGLITNAGPAHLEGFGSLTGVAEAKGEIYQHLPAEATALLNRDDRFYDFWGGLVGSRQQRCFGLHADADVRGEALGAQRLRLWIEDQSIVIQLPLAGEHNLRNAVAAAAATHAAGASLEAIRAGLESIDPVGGRLQRVPGTRGYELIDDTYNANPASVQAALAALDGDPRWLVLGDMAELGDEAEAMHREVGVQARELGFKRFYGVGEYCQGAVSAFGAGGQHFLSVDDLLKTLCKEAPGSQAVILVKGSRSMRMERVVAALRNTVGDE